MTPDLLELQKVDTALMQVSHRQMNLDEHKVLAKEKSELKKMQGEHDLATLQLNQAKAQITELELANEKCESQIAKYSQQLRTVIAPRQAEALQHEIDSAKAERSNNDDQELQLLDATEILETVIVRLSGEIEAQSKTVDAATQSLNLAIESCQRERASLEDKRIGIAKSIEIKLIKLYETKREKRTTPAVAELHGSKCQSCHLDLSVVELGKLKKLDADQIAECPNCDCYLVI